MIPTIRTLFYFVCKAILVIMPTTIFAAPPHSFHQAKKIAMIIFNSHQETLYCRCHYNDNKEVDLRSCNMELAYIKKRSRRIEWEHIVPAENFGRQFACWREQLCEKNNRRYKGRKCCERIDPNFRQAEAELYNLWPSVGLVNQMRSNFRYAALGTHNNLYGCSFQIDKQHHKIEPDDKAKGIVARASLFMSDKYNIRLSRSQKKLFETWNNTFPPASWELEWERRVARIEGYNNPYISESK